MDLSRTHLRRLVPQHVRHICSVMSSDFEVVLQTEGGAQGAQNGHEVMAGAPPDQIRHARACCALGGNSRARTLRELACRGSTK